MEGWRFDSVGRTASGEIRGLRDRRWSADPERRLPGRGTERRGVGKRDEGDLEKQREMEVFIVRESGESALAWCHAQPGRAKPERSRTTPEAVKSAPFTTTYIIY